MLDQHLQNIHQNDREEHARRLGLTLEKFDQLVTSANQAYEIIKELGPFYGREEVKEPTFRITAEPIKLPEGSEKLLTDFGNDILHLGKALQKLPQEQKKLLGEQIDFRIPPTWRIDAIVDSRGKMKVNEIEGVDSASALMMAEMQAYGLQTLQESTAAKLIPTLKAMCKTHKKSHEKHNIALIRTITPFSPHTVNAERFIKFLEILSKETIAIDLLDANAIQTGELKPNWASYDGVMNEQGFSPEELIALGVKEDQVLTSGNYNAIGNKGVFALLFDEALNDFWTEHLGTDRHARLMAILLPSAFIKTLDELEEARKKGQVVKVSWAGTNTQLINRSKGVAIPVEDMEHGSEERWDELKALLKNGVQIIAQDFIMPAQLPTFLRKKGTNLEPVEWRNRVCVKYVPEGNPETSDSVLLTGTEVTLGPEVVPAGRKCAFTAGKLA
jgi:hypothetical protein